MADVIAFQHPGAADVLKPVTCNLGPLGADGIRLRQTVIGVNYIDVYHRSGSYALPLPAVPGVEAVGIVEAMGENVAEFGVGDRVVYAGLPAGSYAQKRIIPASMAIKPPATLDDRLLGGSFLRGLTAHMLLETVSQLQPGQVVLIHAAAGGLGLVLAQWAKQKSAVTLGTVSSQEKAEFAMRYGPDHPILYRQEDFVEATLTLTGGRGADLVIDGIGGDTLSASLRAVRPFGLVASIGQIAAKPDAVDPALLVNRALARPSIVALLADRHAYRRAATAWLDMLSTGFNQPAGVDYSFADAAIAHADLEQGRTCGPVRLIV